MQIKEPFNTKDLLNYARFCCVFAEDNDVISIKRVDGGVQLDTVDGVVYHIPDQGVTLVADDDIVQDLMVKAVMPARLPDDPNVEIEIALRKFMPVSLLDMHMYQQQALLNPF